MTFFTRSLAVAVLGVLVCVCNSAPSLADDAETLKEILAKIAKLEETVERLTEETKLLSAKNALLEAELNDLKAKSGSPAKPKKEVARSLKEILQPGHKVAGDWRNNDNRGGKVTGNSKSKLAIQRMIRSSKGNSSSRSTAFLMEAARSM